MPLSPQPSSQNPDLSSNLFGCRKVSSETHELAQRKTEQMEKLRSALGVSSSGNEGDAFNRELQVGAPITTLDVGGSCLGTLWLSAY